MDRTNDSSTAASRPASAPSAVRRVVRGSLGLLFVGGGTYLLRTSIVGLSDCSAWGCRVHILTTAFGTALVVAGGLFAFAAVVPFGGYRRVLLGLGGGLPGGARLWLGYGGPPAAVPPTVVTAVVLGAAAAICISYVGYRVAR